MQPTRKAILLTAMRQVYPHFERNCLGSELHSGQSPQRHVA